MCSVENMVFVLVLQGVLVIEMGYIIGNVSNDKTIYVSIEKAKNLISKSILEQLEDEQDD